MENWNLLQIEVCMNVANAKFHAFVAEAERIADLVHLGVLSRAGGAEYLHKSATYNQLHFEYGSDRIQKVIAEAFKVAA